MVESASEKGSRRSSHSSARSVESDFSVWSDTGDLAEQLVAAEDPLQKHLRKSLDPDARRRRNKQSKRVHYSQDLDEEGENKAGFVPDLEKIEIPNPPPRRIPRAERVLAAIMSPRAGQTAQIHGLVGKPLL